MKTYAYTYLRKRNDKNGNPRHYISVFRIKNNQPILLGGHDEDVGYRDEIQAACDIILENESGWSKKRYHKESGFNCNSVYEAYRRGIWEKDKPGMKIKIHKLYEAR
jgi:hypothetical protein